LVDGFVLGFLGVGECFGEVGFVGVVAGIDVDCFVFGIVEVFGDCVG